MRRLGSSDYGIPEMGDVRDADTFVLEIDARPGDRYQYIVDGGTPLPDPISRFLPEGVHGPTEIVDPSQFEWKDREWKGVEYRDYVLYEIHVGTFTPEGTLDSAIAKLPYLKELGITALELMPVNAFPGNHNWGYDGVGLYAVQASYGGPEALRRFVDAAHQQGLAVIQDVVYNHLGNEGNYLRQFGPYFTAKHQTPWGEAINYDDEGSHAVRRYIIGNALYWIHEYHMDGLRLDAVQTIKDDSRRHIVHDVAETVHALGRESGRVTTVIAETDENDARYIARYGCDGVWSDDFHHSIHTLITGEEKGYYTDYAGRPDLLLRALNEGAAFQGEISSSGTKFVARAPRMSRCRQTSFARRITTRSAIAPRENASPIWGRVERASLLPPYCSSRRKPRCCLWDRSSTKKRPSNSLPTMAIWNCRRRFERDVARNFPISTGPKYPTHRIVPPSIALN